MTELATPAMILVAHQRRDLGSCICGWDKLGASHPEHMIEMLREAGYLLVPNQQLLMKLRWRTGRKNGRTLYAMVGERPSDEDAMIGILDTPVLAREAVVAHNIQLERRTGTRTG